MVALFNLPLKKKSIGSLKTSPKLSYENMGRDTQIDEITGVSNRIL